MPCCAMREALAVLLDELRPLFLATASTSSAASPRRRAPAHRLLIATALVVLGDPLQRVSFLGPFGTPYVVWPSPF
jgi:hypothetical protein